MSKLQRSSVRNLAVAAGLMLLGACGPTKVVSAPAPPVVVVVTQPEPIPMRPMPPRSASVNMLLPAIGPDGIRNTVNARLNPLEAVWNFRSAWNVAALNCLGPHYQPILDGYKAMLTAHGKRLTKINGEIDKQYRAEVGPGTKAIRARESYNTQVYNYFALPPATDYFCEASLEISNQALLSPPTDLDAFALTSLPKMEAAFERFFQDMEHYRIAVAQWDARYGATPAYATGPNIGATYTSATYGPQSAQTLDLTVARPVAEDFNLNVIPQDPQATPGFTSNPVVQAPPTGS